MAVVDNRSTAALLFLIGVLCATTAAGQEIAVGPGQVTIQGPDGEDPVVLPLPGCTGVMHLVADRVLYVACGRAGLAVVDLLPAPKLRGFQRFDAAEVSGVFLARGVVWAQLLKMEARPATGQALGPLRADPPRDPPATAPTAPKKKAAPVATVLEVGAGFVVISVGSKGGLSQGDRVRIFVEQDVDLGGGNKGKRVEVIAVGEVSDVTVDRSRVRLGLNERVPKGARAQRSDGDLTASRIRPPRLGGLWNLSLNVRPFLALGTLGVGMINDLSVIYRFELPISIQALFEPAGLGFSDKGDIIAMAGNVIVAYDSAYFEIGLGLGWSAVNSDIESTVGAASADDSDGGGVDFERVRSGLSIAQLARLGALDGLNLVIHNSFLLYDDKFNYGGTVGRIQVPLTGRLWMLLNSGGGRSGFVYGELGLRVLLRGNGDRGSVFLTPTVGGGYLFGEKEEDCDRYNSATGKTEPSTCAKSIGYAGPMVGIGVEWRP